MTLEKCIAQLKDLRQDREEFLAGKFIEPDENDPFVNDIKAIDTALAAIEDLLEARKLLRAAVDGFGVLGSELDEHCGLETFDCNKCPVNNGGNCRTWRLKKKALEIIERRYRE